MFFEGFQKTLKVFEGIVSAPIKCIFQFCDRSISKTNLVLQLSPPNMKFFYQNHAHSCLFSIISKIIINNLIQSMLFIDL